MQLPLLGVRPLQGSSSSGSTAMMRVLASTGCWSLSGTNKGLLLLTIDPPQLREAAPRPYTYISWMRQGGSTPRPGQATLGGGAELRTRSVWLPSLHSYSPTTHSMTRPPFVFLTKMCLSSAEVRRPGFKKPTIWLRRKNE